MLYPKELIDTTDFSDFDEYFQDNNVLSTRMDDQEDTIELCPTIRVTQNPQFIKTTNRSEIIVNHENKMQAFETGKCVR